MASTLTINCLRDTVYVDDYSVLAHAGASWEWAFEDAASVIGATTRNAKVVFASTGLKQVIMKLSTPTGIYYDTLHVQVNNQCAMDSTAGEALSLNGTTAYAAAAALNISSNTMTISAWIKPQGVQNDWAGIAFSRSPGASGFSISNTNELKYHWDDGGYGWSSGLIVNDNEWTHVAIVVSPTKVTIYKNGVGASNTYTVPPGDFSAPLHIGVDKNGSPRYFKGMIDEVKVHNYALTQNEIREQMHLTATHTPTAGLIAYYQFNENQGTILDRVGVNHASLVNGAVRASSTVAVAGGYSNRLNVNASLVDFGLDVDCAIEPQAAGTNPNGEVVLTRLNAAPDATPNTSPVSKSYWVAHNFGLNATFSELNQIVFRNIGLTPNTTTISDYVLYQRAPTADGSTWTMLDVCDNILETGADGDVAFSTGNQITQLGQFIITKPTPEPVVGIAPTASVDQAWVYPTILNPTNTLTVKVSEAGDSIIEIYDAQLPASSMASGIYVYQLHTPHHLYLGKLVVE
jgi:hypothetical protein